MLSHGHIRLADNVNAQMMENGGGSVSSAAGTELDDFNGSGGGPGFESPNNNGRLPLHHHQHQHPGMQAASVAATAWCAGCGCQINERFLLQAVDRCWHTRCLKCHQCGIPLSEQGSSCYSKGGMILCRNDYLKLFGSNGTCSGCSLNISATEFVLRSNNNVYHVNCFVCSQCRSPLQPGDRYAIVNGLPVCEPDFPKVFGQPAATVTGAKQRGKKKQPTQKQQQQQQQQQQLQQQQQPTQTSQGGQLQPVC